MLSSLLRRFSSWARSLNSAIRVTLLRLKFPNCKIGKSVYIGSNVEFSVTDGGVLTIGNEVSINSNSVIVVKNGQMTIQDRTFVGWGSVICANESVTIGEDCLIAEYVTIRDQNHGMDLPATPFNQQPMKTQPITIAHDVWIGSRCAILSGVSIGEHSVVGANSVVTRSIEKCTVSAGSPAKTIRNLDACNSQ